MPNITIVKSMDNKQVKSMALLLTKKGRRSEGKFLAEGARTINEAIIAKAEVTRLAILEELLEDAEYKDILLTLYARDIPVLAVSREVLKKISGMETPQGIIAEFEMPALKSLKDAKFEGASVLASDIRDPRNMGLLIRTMEAAGAGPLFVPQGSSDPFHPNAVQTSMGAIFHRNIISGGTSEDVINEAQELGIPIVATVARDGISVQEWRKVCKPDFLLVLGNEGAGIDYSIARQADYSVTIPIYGMVESLNVAVTAGIILYYYRLGM